MATGKTLLRVFKLLDFSEKDGPNLKGKINFMIFLKGGRDLLPSSPQAEYDTAGVIIIKRPGRVGHKIRFAPRECAKTNYHLIVCGDGHLIKYFLPLLNGWNIVDTELNTSR